MKATVFIVGTEMKEKFDKEWKNELKKLITKEDIKQISAEYPNIEFACHSYNLHYEGALENKKYEDFLEDCNTYKKEFLDSHFFAYPYGRHNDDLIKALKDTDFKLAFAFDSIQRKVYKSDDDFLVPRMDVSAGVENWKLFTKLLVPFIF